MVEEFDVSNDEPNENVPDNTEMTKAARAKAFFKRHGLEVVFGIGLSASAAVCIYQRKSLKSKDYAIEVRDALLVKSDGRINELVNLCLDKDARTRALAADALRHGSSE